MLFTDGSVNPQTKVGYGAYLAITDPELPVDLLKNAIRVRRFEHTSSTQLELQTLLWALNDIHTLHHKVIIHADSQNIIGLPARRNRLERQDYRSNKNQRLKNFDLYKQFFSIIDQLQYELVKIEGHQPNIQKNAVDHLFTLVDRASRDALRNGSSYIDRIEDPNH